MTLTELRSFLRSQQWAVQATVTSAGVPQAAVIGVAITDSLELIFDTLSSSRKHANLRRDPKIALVVGWDEARTAQIEGLADRPDGADLERVRGIYLARFADGRERANLPTIAYWRVRPTWIRFSDFNSAPPTVIEWDTVALARNLSDHRR